MQIAAQIARIRQETPTVKSLLLDLQGAQLPFLAGQWVDLYLDSPQGGSEPLVGGFSITSSPLQKAQIELAVKRIPEGRASAYVHDQLRVGDTVEIDGAYGDFFFEAGMSDAIVLIAGGIGITPLMSVIRYVRQAALPVDTTLFYSAKGPGELVFREELQAIAAQNSRVRCILTITQPGTEPWHGAHGRIDRQMLEKHPTAAHTLFYVCGPRGMAQDFRNILNEMGVDASRVKSEEW